MGIFASTRGPGFWPGFWKRWSSWLALGLLIYGLCCFAPGLMLVSLFGMFVIPGTLLLCFALALFLEAISGYLPRIFALPPIAFVIGFYVVLALQWSALDDLQHRVISENTSTPYALNPAVDTVVFEVDYWDRALPYLQVYELPTAYVHTVRPKTDRPWSRVATIGFEGCPPGFFPTRQAQIVRDGRPAPVCLDIIDEPDDLPRAITVRTSRANTSVWGANTWIGRTEATLPDGSLISWTSVRAEKWEPFPFLWAGIGFTSYPAAIVPVFTFASKSVTLVPGPKTPSARDDATVYLLGLKRWPMYVR